MFCQRVVPDTFSHDFSVSTENAVVRRWGKIQTSNLNLFESEFRLDVPIPASQLPAYYTSVNRLSQSIDREISVTIIAWRGPHSKHSRLYPTCSRIINSDTMSEQIPVEQEPTEQTPVEQEPTSPVEQEPTSSAEQEPISPAQVHVTKRKAYPRDDAKTRIVFRLKKHRIGVQDNLEHYKNRLLEVLDQRLEEELERDENVLNDEPVIFINQGELPELLGFPNNIPGDILEDDLRMIVTEVADSLDSAISVEFGSVECVFNFHA